MQLGVGPPFFGFFAAEFFAAVAGGIVIGAAAVQLLWKRRSRSLPPAQQDPALEQRVELLERELAASRALVEQLSEQKRFLTELSEKSHRDPGQR